LESIGGGSDGSVGKSAGGQRKRAGRHTEAAQIQRAAAHRQAIGRATEGIEVAQKQSTRIHVGAARVSVRIIKRDRTRGGFDQSAGSSQHGIGILGAVLEGIGGTRDGAVRQSAAVEGKGADRDAGLAAEIQGGRAHRKRAADRAERAECTQDQRAGVDHRSTRISINTQQGEHAGPGFGETAGAVVADGIGEGEIIAVGVNCAAAGAKRYGLGGDVGGAAGGELEGAAAKVNSAGAQIADGQNINGTDIQIGAARISINSGKSQQAGSNFGEGPHPAAADGAAEGNTIGARINRGPTRSDGKGASVGKVVGHASAKLDRAVVQS